MAGCLVCYRLDRRLGGGFAPRQRQRDGEATSVSRLRLHPDFAPHRRDQPPRNGESEPGAGLLPVPARRGRLIEGLEEMGEVGLGDTGAGVTHGQADRIGLRAVRDLKRDSAAVRELDAVAEQVEQHLAQLLAIAGHRRRHALRNRQVEGELLLPGAALHQHHDVLDQLVQVEDCALHLDLAGFDPRVVENVVENAQ